MIACPYCNYQNITEAAAFCPHCGSHIADESREFSALESERLKFWGGELRILSVFFVDFTGFEKLMDQKVDETVIMNLRECMTEVEEIIKKFDGTTNRIIPDNRVLGVFGAPKAHKDDPLRVVRCAWQIKNWWDQRKDDGGFLQDICVTVGINTGRAFFGYIIQDYPLLTVIGDTVNIAARLSEICPPDEILMSENTYTRIAEYVDVEHVGERHVKGKTAVVDVYLMKDLKKAPKITAAAHVPFCGRDEELNTLIEIAHAAEEGKRQFCIISGQMGIGKTRLKEEFKSYITNNTSFSAIETHCSVEVQSPYYPFKFLLRRYFHLNEFDSKKEVAQKINDSVAQRGLLPISARGFKHLFLTDLQRLNQDELRTINEEIYSSIRNLIKYECHNRPVILIFEEFNRADEMSKYLITYLVAELKNESVMFLMVNVPKDFVANIDISIKEINITPLSKEAARTLVTSMLGDVDDKLIDFFYNSAGGNPLFTIEAVRNTRRTKLIKKVEERWVLEKEQRLSFLDDLYGVVMSTIDSLSPNYRLIIDYASVIGYSFNLRILKGLFKRAHLKEQLQYLTRTGYIVLSRDDADPTYVFRHNLLKDAAYNVLPLRKRKEIHRLVGALLEELYAEQLPDFYENIGHHNLLCEDFAKAAHYFKLAGDKAKNLYAVEQAQNFYNTVLKIEKDTEGQVGAEIVQDALLNLADIYEITLDIQKMERVAQQGLQRAQMDKNSEKEVHFMERYAYALFLNNNTDEAEELLHRSVEKCTETMSGLLSVLYSDLGLLYQHKYEYEKSVLQYNMSWNTTRGDDTKRGEILCLYNLAQLHRDLGNYEQALDYLEYALNDLISPDDIRWLTHFKYSIADINYQIWNIEKSQKILSECFKQSDDIGNIEVYIKSALDLAVIHALNGDQKKVNEYLQFVDEKVSFLIRENLLAFINLKKAIVYYHQSDTKRALDFIMSALKLAQKLGLRIIECNCYNLLSLVDTKNALEHAQHALDIAEMLKLAPLIATALFRITQIFIEEHDSEKVHFYGRKALLMYDDIKFKLNNGNRKTYVRRAEYARLLEI